MATADANDEEPAPAAHTQSDDAPASESTVLPERGSPTPVRIALGVGVLAGLATLAFMPLLRPAQVGIATDVYYHATTAWLTGGDPYAVAPPDHPGFRFVYPPVALLFFLPHALTGSPTGAFLVQTLLSLLAAGALARLLVQSTERYVGRLPAVDRLLIVAFALGSVHTVTVLVQGQVNVLLALAIALGANRIDRARDAATGDGAAQHLGRPGWAGRRAEWAAGTVLALPAIVKLFPAAVGVWLLRLKSWRALAGATLTGLGAGGLGLLAVGRTATRTFLTDVLQSERQTGAFAGGLSADAGFVTIRRPLGALFPGVDPTILALVGAALLAPFVLASYRDVASPAGRWTALLATLLATLTLLPLEPFYYVLVAYPLVPLLYALPAGRGRALLAAGSGGLSLVLSASAVSSVVAVLPVGTAFAPAVENATRAAFAIAQPPLIGVLLVLAACVQIQRELARVRSVDGS